MPGRLIRTIGFFLLASLLLGACGAHVYHQVRKGDTLYSISWRYHQDYREVAKWNSISSPYVIKEGQWLRVTSPGIASSSSQKKEIPHVLPPVITSRPESVVAAKPASQVQAPRPVVSVPKKREQKPINSRDSIAWQWPVNGAVISQYKAKIPGRQGIDIAGIEGLLVNAAASGKVVYSGNALRGYGNLIIIKHNDKYLSAYGHNQSILVKEGTPVKRGQAIARMGKTEADRVKLHFQIRVDGKTVNPLRYLPKRGS